MQYMQWFDLVFIKGWGRFCALVCLLVFPRKMIKFSFFQIRIFKLILPGKRKTKTSEKKRDFFKWLGCTETQFSYPCLEQVLAIFKKTSVSPGFLTYQNLPYKLEYKLQMVSQHTSHF